jgi:hypothetical protein
VAGWKEEEELKEGVEYNKGIFPFPPTVEQERTARLRFRQGLGRFQDGQDSWEPTLLDRCEMIAEGGHCH